MPPPMKITEWGYMGYMAWMGGVAVVLVAPSVIPLGVILPSIWKTTRDIGATGARIGRLTGANTLAAVAGSLAAGFLIIPSLGVARGIVLIGASYGLLAVLAILQAGKTALGSPWSRRFWAAALVVLLTAVWSQQPARLEPVRLGRQEKILHFYEGETASVVVTRRPRGSWMRMNNSYVLGASVRGLVARRAFGRLPLALHPDPKEVAFIGVATGISLSAILDFPEVEHVSAMEVVPGVLDAANAYFGPANHGVLEDPRVKVILADGRNHLFGTRESFDVVVSDLFVPWQAGTGYLYTAEHFEIVRSRLKPGGIFVVWVQMDQVSRRELQIIAGTFVDVFEDSELWLNEATPGWPLVGLVGWQSGGAPRERCADLASEASAPDALPRVECQFAAGAIRRWTQVAERNTDDRPILEFRSGLGHFRLERGEVKSTLGEFRSIKRRFR